MDLTSALNELAQLVHLTDNFAGLSTDKLASVYASALEVMRLAAESLVKATVAEEQVKALLIAIFQDDGETQAKFGTQRAVIDAIILAQARRMELERYRNADADAARVPAKYTDSNEQ